MLSSISTVKNRSILRRNQAGYKANGLSRRVLGLAHAEYGSHLRQTSGLAPEHHHHGADFTPQYESNGFHSG
jgi:hypothetical protein